MRSADKFDRMCFLHLQLPLRRVCPPFQPFLSHTSPQRVRAQGWNVRISHNDFIDQYSKPFYRSVYLSQPLFFSFQCFHCSFAGKLANSAAMSACSSDRERVACIFAAYSASKEVAAKKLEALTVKDDFHVGITLVFMKSRKATAYLQVRGLGVEQQKGNQYKGSSLCVQ